MITLLDPPTGTSDAMWSQISFLGRSSIGTASDYNLFESRGMLRVPRHDASARAYRVRLPAPLSVDTFDIMVVRICPLGDGG